MTTQMPHQNNPESGDQMPGLFFRPEKRATVADRVIDAALGAGGIAMSEASKVHEKVVSLNNQARALERRIRKDTTPQEIAHAINQAVPNPGTVRYAVNGAFSLSHEIDPGSADFIFMPTVIMYNGFDEQNKLPARYAYYFPENAEPYRRRLDEIDSRQNYTAFANDPHDSDSLRTRELQGLLSMIQADDEVQRHFSE